jgi:cell wall-associated NlpC family hydrolase
MIPPSEWLQDVFAEMVKDEDVIREPRDDYSLLSEKEKDKLRQTQVFSGEVVQMLGTYAGFKLIRKFDGTKGWVKELVPSSKTAFEIPGISETTESFLKKWKGVPYVFGGCSLLGIDCSAFVQSYFLSVHGVLLPKNSRDQRKITVGVSDYKDFDLIFCHPRSDAGSHHVVLFYQGRYWHSRRVGGVVVQTEEEFLRDFEAEDHRRVAGF